MSSSEKVELVDPPQAVGAGYSLRRAAQFPKALTKIAIDDAGHAALLVRDDHDLRVFDVDRWRTQLRLDPERQFFAREVVQRYLLARGLVTLAFTADAGHVVVVDAANMVTLMDRVGNILWRHAAEPPDLSPDWRFHGGIVFDDGALVRVVATWWRHLYTESDGTPFDEEILTATRFDKQSGRISRTEAGTPPPVEPTITCVRYGKKAGIYVRDERLSLDRRFGDHRSIAVSKDERRILVATEESYLLLLERK